MTASLAYPMTTEYGVRSTETCIRFACRAQPGLQQRTLVIVERKVFRFESSVYLNTAALPIEQGLSKKTKQG